MIGAAASGTFWFGALVGLMAALLASPLLVVAHELAHAAVARGVGLRVLAIELGRGTARRAWWLGGVNVVLRSWPRHGRVHTLLVDRRGLRLRVVAMALAGPMTNVLVAGVLVWLAVALSRSATSPTGTLVVMTMFAVQACVHAVASLSPRLFGGRTWLSSDLALAIDVLRGSEDDLRATLPSHRAAAEHWRCFTAFANGDLTAAAAIVAAQRGNAQDPFAAEWNELAALLAVLRGDTDTSPLAVPAAEAHRAPDEACVEVTSPAHCVADRAGIEPPHGSGAPARTATSADGIERAFLLLLLRGTPEALAEATAIAEHWPRPIALLDADAVAIERVSGWLLIRRGQLAEGLRRLRRALRAEEPFWLQALTMAHLAEAHLALGQPRDARRWAARARRLHPRSPLWPLLLDPLQPLLTTTSARAPLGSIR